VRPPLEQDSPLGAEPSGDPAQPGAKKKKGGAASFFKELPVLILIAFGLAMLIKTFLVQAFFIPSASMEPTLHGCEGCRGDRVLVNKLIYRFRDPHRGEVIVFVAEHTAGSDNRSFFRKAIDNITEGLGVSQPADRDFIKRIIGLPGETVDVKEGTVTITTVAGSKITLNEPYISQERDLSPFGPFKVPPDTYFVMGDNRPNSADSRTRLGPIKRSDIIGKAFVKVWPLNRIGLLRTPKYAATGAIGATAVSVPIVALRRRRRHRAGRLAA
jgi:signal peptidase I